MDNGEGYAPKETYHQFVMPPWVGEKLADGKFHSVETCVTIGPEGHAFVRWHVDGVAVEPPKKEV